MPETRVEVHLLDMGPEEYGDGALCRLGDVSVLIDGGHPADRSGRDGHPSFPDQLGTVLEQAAPPYKVTLLVVTHAHTDHIGCLPALVDADLLRPRWALVVDERLGWGRSAADPPDDRPPTDARRLAAALREEIRTEGTTDADLARLMEDAVTLETRYTQMLTTLEDRGTRVVRFGRDDPGPLRTALRRKGVRLRILGPNEEQLLAATELIRIRTDAADAQFAELAIDADPVTAYRNLTDPNVDAIDARSRPGPPVNLQSIVTVFEHGGRKLLFAGDMQLARPEVRNAEIERGVADLRQRIADGAPYDFVKLSHHGSDNAFDDEMLAELGATETVGICAGAGSTVHPHPEVLRLLDDHRDELTWVRTDRNGLSTIRLEEQPPAIELTSGRVNDARPNVVDVVAPPEVVVGPPASTVAEAVEVTTKIPHVRTRVTVTIDVAPEPASVAPPETVVLPSDLAGGRRLPNLLFVTNRERLAANIGTSEADGAIAGIEASGHAVLDEVVTDSADAVAAVQARLADGIEGVVLVGGYDVVPSRRVDCLPPGLRDRVGDNDDADDFIVWSDDAYGDRNGDHLAEIPVSRIPDGRSARLVHAALGARPTDDAEPRTGVRNVARPFAEAVYGSLPGRRPLLVSQPTTFTAQVDLGGERTYLMLHGDWTDGSRFWGEDTPNNVEAVNVSNVPPRAGRVVFTGCCWGALTVDTPANRVVPGRAYGFKTPTGSLALTFLLRGATAFVGCTGSHYSPTESPYRYFGGPLHRAFWENYEAGAAPAEALLAAKGDYAAQIPHGQRSALGQAIEYKIFRQYTCLGLGW